MESVPTRFMVSIHGRKGMEDFQERIILREHTIRDGGLFATQAFCFPSTGALLLFFVIDESKSMPLFFTRWPFLFALLFFALPAQGREWHTEPGCRWADLEAPKPGKSGFTLLARESTGVAFTNSLDELSGAANRVLYNGSGVAVGDFDNDGRPDLFFCSLSGHNALFKNLGGWRFKDVTAEAGLGPPVRLTRGATFADINGDGHLDLLLAVTGRGALCFLNDGQGKFREVTAAAGTGSKYGSTTLTLADVDGNGTLDLYIANYRPDDIRDRGRVAVSMVNGKPVMAGDETNRFVLLNGRLDECGQPDQLLLNDGAGRFLPVSWTDGTFLDETGHPLKEPPLDWGLTATFRDVNDDRAPDLYVANDYWSPDRFWINDGRGHFRAIPKLAQRKTSASSMSVDFADIDRDGLVDFFVNDMLSRDPCLRKREGFAQMLMATPVGAIDDRPQVMRNTVFLNRGDGTFAEIGLYANLAASDWSWAPIFVDVDLDGYEDLVVGAGHFRDVQDYDAEQQVRARQHPWAGFKTDAERQAAFTRELMEHYHLYPLLRMPVVAFRNLGDCTFAETTETWGLNHPGVHQGLALADLDQDGDMDLVVNSLNTPAMVFRNDSPAGRVAIRLKGKSPNTQGIGAKISLLNGAVPRQTTEIICGGHYLSGSDTEAVFAAGAAREAMTIEVRWRCGARSVVPAVQSNRVYEIEEGEAGPADAASPKKVAAVVRPSVASRDAGGVLTKTVTTPADSRDGVESRPGPIFEDVSDLIAHQHHETEFNDFERQPLLPFKLSQLGPGVAWFDLDGDGHDDLVVGTGRGGAPAVFRSDGTGKFTPGLANPSLTVTNDTAGLVGWDGGLAARSMLVGLTGYEVKSDQAAMVIRLTNNLVAAEASFASEMAGGGALTLGDMNGDGHLALFVAGGVLPGQYPLGAPSKLYRFDGRQWKLDAKNSLLFNNIGIVNGAVWSDLDGDGLPELVLACEWGPIRVFRNRAGLLFEVTEELGLTACTGWWRGVTTGDLNQDGRMDIIASNWGLNSPYRASETKPLVFVFGQLAQPGVTEIIETEYLGSRLVPRRQFQAMVSSMPFLYERFTSHKAYSEATLDEVLGDRAPLSRRIAVNSLASMAFINTGKGFKAVELPREAQFAPAFSVSVADFDGDGNEDVFLSQNFFDLQPEVARIDAGLGLWLAGDGTGKLVAVSGARSGIKVYGEQRGAAVGDYDEDGRVDLVVSQNGAATKLYHNVGASPGLRVKLKGRPGNPPGIGAVLRLQFKDRQGPAREIHAGSGYWSQDSLTQVMASSTKPDGIWIRWPGGRTTTTPIPAGAQEIMVDFEGKLAAQK